MEIDKTINDEIVERFRKTQLEKIEFYSDMVKKDADVDKYAKMFKDNEDLQLYFRLIKVESDAVWGDIIIAASLHKDAAMEVINKCETKEQLAQWWMTTYKPCGMGSYDVYKRARFLTEALFKYIKPSGYYAKTNQSMAQMNFANDELIDLKIMREELDIWVKYIIPDENGWKILKIMEPSLSRYGSYHAYVKDDIMKMTIDKRERIVDKIDNTLKLMTEQWNPEQCGQH